jgi:hypothetical protein
VEERTVGEKLDGEDLLGGVCVKIDDNVDGRDKNLGCDEDDDCTVIWNVSSDLSFHRFAAR